jgi:NADH:ubiquinone oxidoreductase subunit 5 (subunit L)/multisubunit Na+/H+ antiporter MnhA subunit
LASLAALVEVDAKKVVALSTLSQLGLMIIRLRLGNALICFFHIIIHALAKANLFIVIGNVLHFTFSQQDNRKLSNVNLLRIMGGIVRIFRLRGVCFIAGFYSKEQILGSYFSIPNRVLCIFIFIIIIRLTLTYRTKILFYLRKTKEELSTTLLYFREV